MQKIKVIPQLRTKVVRLGSLVRASHTPGIYQPTASIHSNLTPMAIPGPLTYLSQTFRVGHILSLINRLS